MNLLTRLKHLTMLSTIADFQTDNLFSYAKKEVCRERLQRIQTSSSF